MRYVVIAAVIAIGLAVPSWFYLCPPEDAVAPAKIISAREALELEFKNTGRMLAKVALPKRKGDERICMSFTPALLKTHKLYLRPQKGRELIYVTCQSDTTPCRGRRLVCNEQGAFIATQAGLSLLVDSDRTDGLEEWQHYWVVKTATKPELTKTKYPRRQVVDGFMRTALLDDNWKVPSGDWMLKQYGGGMPRNEQQMSSYHFQRAVNPFSVLGHGLLAYGKDDWFDAQAEASFYFGKPWKRGAVDTSTLPPDMFIAHGRAGRRLVGFGWHQASSAFCLLEKRGDHDWRVLATHKGGRPAISNWAQIGLRVSRGSTIEGLLDGKVVLSIPSPFLTGPFYVYGGEPGVEFDDFRACTLPKPQRTGFPVHVRSRNFAGKKQKGKADPSEFAEWAKGTSIFSRIPIPIPEKNEIKAAIVSRAPLMGDFLYCPKASDVEAGELPRGIYEIELMTNATDRLPRYTELVPVLTQRFRLDATGWHRLANGEETPLGPALQIRRRKENGDKIEVMTQSGFIAMGYRNAGSLHIVISRVFPRGTILEYPRAEHHQVLSQMQRNELFERAPINWSWVEGGFRMDCRWACQERWNFMACGSTSVPMLVSKERYSGDQEHEYYASLRPMFPSDAGDRGFVYRTNLHRKFLAQMQSWYNRHDINFSFCTDGRNPLSGYSVLFGANDNRETLLLRKGEVVARTKKALFPTSRNILSVHWKWWTFNVRKYHGRVMVFFHDKLIFDYLDENPIEGGHLAFWSVRNGFTIAKISSCAQMIDRVPDVLYVNNDNTGDSPWKPLVRDAVQLSYRDGETKVSMQTGVGFQAVRCELRPPVIIQRKPIMELPLQLAPSARVNLHLFIDDKSWLVQLSAPLAGAKALLTPEYEPSYNMLLRQREDVRAELTRNEMFRIPVISEDRMQQRVLTQVYPGRPIKLDLEQLLKAAGYTGPSLLRSITIGNSSNADYLLAGSQGNQAGTYYIVGTPTFSKRPSNTEE